MPSDLFVKIDAGFQKMILDKPAKPRVPSLEDYRHIENDATVGRRVRLRDPALYEHFLKLMADKPRTG